VPVMIGQLRVTALGWVLQYWIENRSKYMLL